VLRCASWGSEARSIGGVPRDPRNLYAGIYHLAARGSDIRHLFLADTDREEFLERLAAIWAYFDLGLISYVLMGNHYHALVRIPDARLSQALQHLHTEYSRWHNRRHGRSAHLFRAHAMTKEIASDRQLVAASRYLALNPVVAGLVQDPLAWRWSSARTHAGLEQAPIPLAEDDLRAAFGNGDDWRERYRSTIEGTAAETYSPIQARTPSSSSEPRSSAASR
jgi:REP element-mobilizing transposase RayT